MLTSDVARRLACMLLAAVGCHLHPLGTRLLHSCVCGGGGTGVVQMLYSCIESRGVVWLGRLMQGCTAEQQANSAALAKLHTVVAATGALLCLLYSHGQVGQASAAASLVVV